MTKTLQEVMSDFNTLTNQYNSLFENEAQLKHNFCQAEHRLCSSLKKASEESDNDLRKIVQKECNDRLADETKARDVYVGFLMDFVGNMKQIDRGRMDILFGILNFYQRRVGELEGSVNSLQQEKALRSIPLPSIREDDDEKKRD